MTPKELKFASNSKGFCALCDAFVTDADALTCMVAKLFPEKSALEAHCTFAAEMSKVPEMKNKAENLKSDMQEKTHIL